MDSIAWVVQQFSAFVEDPSGYRHANPADDDYVAKIAEALAFMKALQSDQDGYRRALLMVHDVVELALLKPAQPSSLVESD